MSALAWAKVDFAGHGISSSPLRLRVTNSGSLGGSSLRSYKSAAARLKEFFLGGIALKTPENFLQSLQKDVSAPPWNVTEVLQLSQLPHRLRM